MTATLALSNASARYEPDAVQSLEGLPRQQPAKVIRRQPRCVHGFVCVDDGNPRNWTCPKCKNPGTVQATPKRAEYWQDLLDTLRQHEVTTCFAARQALIETKGITRTVEQIEETVWRLRKSGKLVGFEVVG